MRVIYFFIAMTFSVISHAQFVIDWEQLPGNIPKYATLPASATMPFIWADGVPDVTDGLYINVDGTYEFAGSNSSESNISEAVEQVRIYQESFVTASDSVSWVFELPDNIRVDRDWEPFGGTLGGYSFKPGIGAGDYPGEDGTLFVTVQTGFIPADTKGELLYRYSAVSGHISTPTGQSPDFPIRYFEQGGLGWK